MVAIWSSRSYSKPYSLLITDVDEMSRETIREFFEPDGYNTYMAGSGKEAIEIARDVLIHALITDMNLPDISGLETFRFIKKEFQIVLPCILLTRNASKEMLLRAISAEAYAVISKPTNLDVLRFAMKQIMKKYYRGEGKFQGNSL
ncbi:MAG: response regulator [Planctomycetes bacterium]|nr:response regulator [Planctomycetota bacterium]